MEQYIKRIQGMTNQELLEEAENKIWLASYNPRSEYTPQAAECYNEACRRGKPEIYTIAYENARESI